MKGLDELDVSDKKVLVRVDFNVPISKGIILDDTRMRMALPTINYLLEKGSKVILMSHLGRPLKKLNSDGEIDRKSFSLVQLCLHLSELLGRKVLFCEESSGEKALKISKSLKEGEVLLLENTRFQQGEKKGDVNYAKALSELAEVFVNDAFGTAHRAHSSTAIVSQFFDDNHKAAGYLLAKEIEYANRLVQNPAHPFTAIIGGAKVSDKIEVLEELIDKCDNVLIGGAMAYTFFLAKGGSVGNSLVEIDKIDIAKEAIVKAEKSGTRLLIPVDSIIADDFSEDANIKVCSSDSIPGGWMGLDIGPKAIEEFSKIILESKTVFWNGPMGVFELEKFSKGTMSIANVLARVSSLGCFTMVGGGDSVSAINQSGQAERISFISTGGGAMLEYIEGKKLPAIVALG